MGARSFEKGDKALSDLQARKPTGSLSTSARCHRRGIENAVQTVEKDFGRLDVLIDNAAR